MAADRQVSPIAVAGAMLTPLEKTVQACALCPYTASGQSIEAVRAHFKEHIEWHREQTASSTAPS